MFKILTGYKLMLPERSAQILCRPLWKCMSQKHKSNGTYAWWCHTLCCIYIRSRLGGDDSEKNMKNTTAAAVKNFFSCQGTVCELGQWISSRKVQNWPAKEISFHHQASLSCSCYIIMHKSHYPFLLGSLFLLSILPLHGWRTHQPHQLSLQKYYHCKDKIVIHVTTCYNENYKGRLLCMSRFQFIYIQTWAPKTLVPRPLNMIISKYDSMIISHL